MMDRGHPGCVCQAACKGHIGDHLMHPLEERPEGAFQKIRVSVSEDLVICTKCYSELSEKRLGNRYGYVGEGGSDTFDRGHGEHDEVRYRRNGDRADTPERDRICSLERIDHEVNAVGNDGDHV